MKNKGNIKKRTVSQSVDTIDKNIQRQQLRSPSIISIGCCCRSFRTRQAHLYI